MNSNGLSLRKLATVLGVSQPFLSQIRAGKRPLPEALKRKVEALDAYHLLIGDKQVGGVSGEIRPDYTEKRVCQIRMSGAGGGIRTPGFLLGNQTLYH